MSDAPLQKDEDLNTLSEARVMITGGLGLIGSTLARKLLDKGAKILLVDSLNPNFGGNLFNVREIKDRIRINISDIRDIHGMKYLLAGCDFIFNLAGQTSHMDSMTAPFEDLEINCQAQLSLLEACRQINPSVRIVFASTRQIYGRPLYTPVDERHPLAPVDVNGINKIAGESYHLLYCDAYNLRTTALRLTNTYGPGMRIKDARQIFIGIWVRNILEGHPLEVWGGEQRRDFTFVDDAADAFITAALNANTIGKAFNIGGHGPVTLKQLAEELIRANGQGEYVVREFPPERRKIDIGDYVSDDAAFRTVTGWAPQVELGAGIKRTLNHYREHMPQYL